jgi:hypothetical protein
VQATASVVVVVACLFLSVRHLRRSAPRPPRRWSAAVPEGATS